MPLSPEKKEKYFAKLRDLIDQFSKLFIVTVDNVGSKQMQQIRAATRTHAEVLMGKNTMIRRIIKDYVKENPGHPIENLLPKVNGNCGFVFCKGDMAETRQLLENNRVPAPARVGAIAPVDVVCPAGGTGMDPGQTGFFQALNIATKISRGQIEITTPVLLTAKGDKVGNSEAVLCQKLGILPFTYGLVIDCVYDNGSVFSAEVLSLTDDVLKSKFKQGASIVAAASIEIGFPSLASLPHSIANAFKNLVAIAVEHESLSFEKSDNYIAFLKDPSAFACAGGGGGGGSGDAAPAAEEKVEEEEEEEEVDMGAGNMFGGDDEDY